MGRNSKEEENFRVKFEAENTVEQSSISYVGSYDLLSILREFLVFGDSFRSRRIEYLSSHKKSKRF